MPNIKCQKENSPKNKVPEKKYIKFYGTQFRDDQFPQLL